MFTRIAIVNRGEAAMRLIHAVRDLNASTAADEPRARTIALHTDGERRAMFVREADEAYDLGPASARPYLDHAVLERALRETGADAVWVGWGFVAEDPAFAELCGRLGVTFVGPSPQAMRRLGDKIGSKLLAEEVGVPVADWSRGGVDTVEDALAQAERIGYPLMLKATAGGGGRGIRTVTGPEELTAAYQLTRDEATRAFGNGTVFLERMVTGARHVEVQVIADAHGTAWALGVRDCSVQRRNQKVVEESASPVLAPEQVAELKASAERLALAVDYCGAGTVEFLYHPAERFFAFLEVNTRLQVEHSITEVTTGTDLVRLQLHVAAGGRLDDLSPVRPTETGHAIEARLNAEDPDRDFAPAPGRIALLELPAGPGVRVDTGVAEGDTIPADFDSMIAKVIASGRDRAEALARLRRALQETTVVVEGGATNKSFVLDLLDQPEVVDGSADTGWVDRVRAQGRLVDHRHSGAALVAAGIRAYEADEAIARARLLETARGGRPQLQHEPGRRIETSLRGTTYGLRVARTGHHRYRVVVDSPTGAHTVEADLEHLDEHKARLTLGGRHHRLVVATHGPVQLVEVDGVTHRISFDEGGVLRSPTPALVVATPVAAGAEVAAGAPVLVLESMKMETVLPAPFAARVREVLVATGSQVETGTPLVRLEPIEEEPTATPAAGPTADVDLDLPGEQPAADPAARRRADLLGLVLGYDADPQDERRALTAYLAERDRLAATGSAPVAEELELLEVFADLAELSRNRPAGEDLHLENRVHSPREHLHTYLQSLDADRAELPETFRTRLAAVLARHGVTTLERTPELEQAVFRIVTAQQRSAPDVAAVTALLQRWSTEPAPAPPVDARAREALDHLVRATQLRHPVVGELARSVRYRWFEQPQAAARRGALLDRVTAELDRLGATDVLPGGADQGRREALLDTLVAVPEQIGQLLGARLARCAAPGPHPEVVLEVLLRRHYRGQDLADVTSGPCVADPAVGLVTGTCEVGRRPTYLVSAAGRLTDLTPGSALARALAAQVAQAPTGREAVVDLYLACADPHAVAADNLVHRLAHLPVARAVRRLTVGLAAPGQPVRYLTVRPTEDGAPAEDTLVHGVHPMVGRRLHLWRLREYAVTRLDAPEDVLLYRCAAPDNDTDVRLVALAQVRHLTIARDDQGRVAGLPEVERALADCLEAIRRARAAAGAGARHLDSNQVWLHVWQPVDADLTELTGLKDTIAPMTAGTGVEEVLLDGTVVGGEGTEIPVAARFYYQPGAGVVASVENPPSEPLHPLDDYALKVQRARRRGMVYPYELVDLIAGRGGTAIEHDLDESGRLAPVDRPYGRNRAGMIVGVISTPTARHPQGVRRVLLCGDPLRALGALGEPECARVIAALDLAEELGVPVEWFSLSAGARISMDSGTENLDWVARALRRIVHFTQAGGEINVVVAGINVGAQPYWNAEATMLMHTKGILVMTPDSAMVLTGKQSLDFSGGVSAEDNVGIGGYDRIMGPNGQAQYWAPDLAGALRILMTHYDHAYVAPGERGPRSAITADPVDRDVSAFPHDPAISGFATVGEIFGADTNPDRKKAFAIRSVMAAVADQDHETLERWAGMADAETAVVWDAHLGGLPVTMVGIESQQVARRGFPPTDGPDAWTAGTLFPRSSKKVARAVNAASGNRPVVVLANLSGFDGSPESMRTLQLEYGAEIGRAIVNFDGPIVFVVISRYHGGAFVVFSKALNPRMTVLAVEGSYASVIGGAPAAAVVFPREVDARTAADPGVVALEEQVAAASGAERADLAARLTATRREVRAEKLAEVATEFDRVHDVHRAVQVGSVDEVIAARDLRPAIVRSLRRGLGLVPPPA
ncbi:carboxyl transferase domain-containing protein [Arsenicicoccus dermatophilus]|uniref:ATP-binding protein n=1 Tax=Arsenicicoccus dermatophilus TaxID=1076331 RepID=UPI003916D994